MALKVSLHPGLPAEALRRKVGSSVRPGELLAALTLPYQMRVAWNVLQRLDVTDKTASLREALGSSIVRLQRSDTAADASLPRERRREISQQHEAVLVGALEYLNIVTSAEPEKGATEVVRLGLQRTATEYVGNMHPLDVPFHLHDMWRAGSNIFRAHFAHFSSCAVASFALYHGVAFLTGSINLLISALLFVAMVNPSGFARTWYNKPGTLEITSIFGIHHTFADHTYVVRDTVSGHEKRVEADTVVMTAHTAFDLLKLTIMGVPRRELAGVFSYLFHRSVPHLFDRIAYLMEETGIEVLRLDTDLNPDLLEFLKPFETTAVALHEQQGDNPSAWNQRLTRWIKRSSQTRLHQIFYNMRTKPPWKWLKTHPMRTYLIFRDDVELIRQQASEVPRMPGLDDPRSGRWVERIPFLEGALQVQNRDVNTTIDKHSYPLRYAAFMKEQETAVEEA